MADLSAFDIAAVADARNAAWSVLRGISDPQTSLVLVRAGVSLAAQAVVVDWISRRGARDQEGIGAAVTDADVIFTRTIDDGFDVARNDRFAIQGQTGQITRVYQDAALVVAEATIDVRS